MDERLNETVNNVLTDNTSIDMHDGALYCDLEHTTNGWYGYEYLFYV